MFRIEAPSIRRASACMRTTSTPVAPGRTPGTSRLAYIGASEWMSERGTNSVKPPVSFWIERSKARCRTQWAGVSTWPYMMVEVVRSPRAWAVVRRVSNPGSTSLGTEAAFGGFRLEGQAL